MSNDVNSPVKKSVSVPAVGEVRPLVDFAVELEEAGWDGFFLWDHLQVFPEQGLAWSDPWVLLGAIAHATTRIRLGTMVTPVSRRRPWKLAKEAVTLDHVSEGRAVLGIGLGAPEEDEFGAFGEITDLRERAERTDEGLEIIDRVLRGEPVEHTGDHWDVHAHLHPVSVQSPRLPIWIAATPPFEKPLERAARWDGVFCNMVRTGTEAAPMTPDEVRDYVGDLLDRDDFAVGTPRHPAHSLDEYAEVGVSWIRESCFPGPNWLEDFRKHIHEIYA